MGRPGGGEKKYGLLSIQERLQNKFLERTGARDETSVWLPENKERGRKMPGRFSLRGGEISPQSKRGKGEDHKADTVGLNI